MIKRFLKDSFIYGVGRILTYGVTLFLIPFYTRVFPPSDYGVIDILNTLESLLGIAITLEIGQAVIRLLPDAKTPKDRIQYASTAFWFTVIIYVIFIVVAWLFTDSLSYRVLDSRDYQSVFQVAVLAMGFVKLLTFAQNQLRWQLKAREYTLSSLLFVFSSALFSVFFILALNVGVIGVFYGELVGAVLACGLAIFYSRQDYKWTFDWSKLWEMLKFSAPLVPSSISFFLYLYIDRLAIRELLGMSELGIFGIGYRLASLVSLLMFGFQISLTPLIYTHYNDPKTPSELARLFRLFVAVALLMCIGLSIFAYEILIIFTTPQYYGAATVVPFLVPATLLFNMYIFAPGLSIEKKTGQFAVINIIGAILNVILIVILIPIWGIVGAAFASFMSSGLIFGMHLFQSQRYYYVPHNWLSFIVAVLVSVTITYFGLQLDFNSTVDFALKIGLLIFAGVVFIRIGLVRLDEITTTYSYFQQLIIGRQSIK